MKNLYKALPSIVSGSIAMVVLFGSHKCYSDDWAYPEPASYHARGYGYVAEIFPPNSRQNNSIQPVCILYQMGYPGTTWKIDAKLIWKNTLINRLMPAHALISMEGDVVTLNEYGSLGYKNAVSIYDAKGKLTKTYEMSELIPSNDLALVETSVSSRWWNREARYFFLRNPARLYIVLKSGKALRFTLSDGAFSYKLGTDFPEISKMVATNISDEEAQIWQTNLRFSSITDILAERNSRVVGSH